MPVSLMQPNIRSVTPPRNFSSNAMSIVKTATGLFGSLQSLTGKEKNPAKHTLMELLSIVGSKKGLDLQKLYAIKPEVEDRKKWLNSSEKTPDVRNNYYRILLNAFSTYINDRVAVANNTFDGQTAKVRQDTLLNMIETTGRREFLRMDEGAQKKINTDIMPSLKLAVEKVKEFYRPYIVEIERRKTKAEVNDELKRLNQQIKTEQTQKAFLSKPDERRIAYWDKLSEEAQKDFIIKHGPFFVMDWDGPNPGPSLQRRLTWVTMNPEQKKNFLLYRGPLGANSGNWRGFGGVTKSRKNKGKVNRKSMRARRK